MEFGARLEKRRKRHGLKPQRFPFARGQETLNEQIQAVDL
jgi:hypothetical protein